MKISIPSSLITNFSFFRNKIVQIVEFAAYFVQVFFTSLKLSISQSRSKEVLHNQRQSSTCLRRLALASHRHHRSSQSPIRLCGLDLLVMR